jgi:hypothetical protein
MDAIRVEDGLPVMLKRIHNTPELTEFTMAFSLNSTSCGVDPHNRTIRICDILQIPDDPDNVILVMSLLRKWYEPEFDTIGEVIDFCQQMFEVDVLMRSHLHIAHYLTDTSICSQPKCGPQVHISLVFRI